MESNQIMRNTMISSAPTNNHLHHAVHNNHNGKSLDEVDISPQGFYKLFSPKALT